MKETEYDIEILRATWKSTRAAVRGLTGDGRHWLVKHMHGCKSNGSLFVAVSELDEVIEFVKSSKLKVRVP